MNKKTYKKIYKGWPINAWPKWWDKVKLKDRPKVFMKELSLKYPWPKEEK